MPKRANTVKPQNKRRNKKHIKRYRTQRQRKKEVFFKHLQKVCIDDYLNHPVSNDQNDSSEAPKQLPFNKTVLKNYAMRKHLLNFNVNDKKQLLYKPDEITMKEYTEQEKERNAKVIHSILSLSGLKSKDQISKIGKVKKLSEDDRNY